MGKAQTRTKTQPGLGSSADSGELKRVRNSGTQPRTRVSRSPVTVDDVGPLAVKLARGLRESAPKLVASRTMIARAPLDTRAAFVLSLVDGRNSTTAIVDMAGMPEEEVKAILDRLARLGLITPG